MVKIPTLNKDVHHTVRRALQDLEKEHNALERRHAELLSHVGNMPKPLTLQEISQGLSATGGAPLDVTGLLGKLAP